MEALCAFVKSNLNKILKIKQAKWEEPIEYVSLNKFSCKVEQRNDSWKGCLENDSMSVCEWKWCM